MDADSTPAILDIDDGEIMIQVQLNAASMPDQKVTRTSKPVAANQ